MPSAHLFARSSLHSFLRSTLIALLAGLTPVFAFAALTASVTAISLPAQGIYPGETATLRITLSNNAGASINNVAFSNSLPGTLPNGLSVIGTPTSSCGGTFTAGIDTQVLTLASGIIPAASGGIDGTCVIDIPVTAGTSTGNPASYAYEILSNAVTSSGGSNTGAVSQTIPVRGFDKPQISKNFTSDNLVLGGPATALVITVTNPNPAAIANIGITDNFPSTIKVATPVVASTTCGGTFSPVAGAASVSSTGGTLPARSGGVNGSCTYTVNVEAAQTNGIYSSTQTNTIDRTTGFSNALGLAAENNATDEVTVRSPLSVGKNFAHAALSNGQSDSLTILLSNSGNTPLAITSFTDSPIDGVGGIDPATGLNITSTSTSCAGGTATAINSNKGVQLTGGTIPANGSCTLTVNFTGNVQSSSVPVTYTNNIPENAVNVGNAAIHSQAASSAVLVFDDLRVVKSASPSAPSTVAPGNPIRYRITVQNFGVGAVGPVTVTDPLTNGQTFLTGVIGGINYTPSGTGSCSSVTSASALNSTSPVFTIDTIAGRSDPNTPGFCTITMWVMTSKTGVATANNFIPAGSVCYNAGANCNGGDSNNTATGSNTPVLRVVKAFAESAPGQHVFAEGTIVRMTITLTNKSANPLTNVSIADTLQVGSGAGQLRIANPSNAASTCGSPTITAVAGSTSIGVNGATIPARANNGLDADGSCLLQVDVVGPAGVYNNTATVGGTETFANGTTQSITPLVSNTATVTYTSALGATKIFNPASVSSGGKSTVSIRLTNASSLALTNVSLSDPLPSGMVLANPANAYTTCAGATSITAVAGANNALLSGANIAGGGNCAFLFDVVATGSANWVNTIPAETITADGGVRNVSDVVGTLFFNTPNGIALSKTTSISSLTFPGQVSRLTINISNGSQAVTNLRLTDHFTNDGTASGTANGWVLTPSPAPETTCPGGVLTAVPDSRSVAITGANLASNAVCQISVNVTSTVTGGNTNTIPAAAITTDQGLSNASPATTSLAISTNIGIVKQFTPNVVKPGERSRLRITFYNALTQPVTNLAVTDNLPAGVTVPAGANPTTTCSGATITAPGGTAVQVNGGSIAAAVGATPSSCQVEIDVLVAAQGDYINTISANALTGTAGGNPVTNTQPTTDTLRAKSPVIAHKAFSSLTLDAGNPVGFTTGTDTKVPGTNVVLTIRFDNPNNAALTGLVLTDVLPTGLVIANTPAAATTCVGGTVIAAASATSVRITGATIPANGNCNLTVNVLSNVPGTYTNVIDAGDITTIEGVTNEVPTNAQLIISTPPAISKQFSPSIIPSGGVSRLSIFITNDNAAAMTLTSNFDDILPTAPGQVSLTATPTMTTTCGGTVVANANAISVRLNSGGTIPAGGCSIEVNVTGIAAGVHTNNIPAGALQTNLGNNQTPANATLTISTRGYISGKIFKDNNVTPDGVFQSGSDTPLVAETVQLRSGANCSGALLATTSTDALGNYIFADLAAGSYSVCQATQPAGTTNGITTAGAIQAVNGSTGTVGTAANPTATSSQITNILLNANGSGEISGSINNNFAEVAASSISGQVFKDNNATPNGTFESGVDTPLAGVTIQLLNTTNVVVATTQTDADGNYRFDNLLPGTYSILEPTQPAGTANGITTAGAVPGGTPGVATTPAVAPSKISGIVLPPNTSSSGNNFAEEPRGGATGVVYDAITRQPVSGATLTISGPAGFNPATDVVGGTANFTTGPDGLYQFPLNSSAPSGTYTIAVSTYPAGYLPSPSNMLPVCSNGLQVAPTPNPALVQTGVTAPTTAVPQQNPAACATTSAGLSANQGSTPYYFSFNFSNTPGPTRSAIVGNNHIPLDPILGGAILMTKSTPLVNVVRSDLVPYTITATNTLNAVLSNINVVDTIPPGFRYRTGSATLNGAQVEPQVTGRNLTWPNQTFNAGERKTWRMLLVVGTGVSEGEYVNRVSAINSIANSQVSNTASATVRVVPDPTFDCSDIIGKVFDDKNANGYQDQGEPGIANVRIATARGLLVTSDQDGRFHVACAAIPNADRGSNFVMKLDERTLPSGYRVTTENPRDVRVTRGKMVKLNFGATVHRVIRLDLSGAAFIGDSKELQASYLSELEKLPEQLQARPSVLRIAYRRGTESADLAKQRIDAVSKRMQSLWHAKRQKDTEESEPLVPLMIETEMEAAQ